MYVVLVYDISGEGNGQKVLGKVFKTCKKYLTHIQNSVFEGEITAGQIVKLNAELNKLIRKDLDSMIIFKSRNEKWLDKELFFSVDPSKIKYYSIGKKTTLIPLKKHRKNKTVKIVYCGSNGNGLLKSSKIEFSKAIRA